MHGVRVELLEQQAQALGLPLYKLMVPEFPSMQDYDRLLQSTLKKFRAQGVEYSIFGDIFLEDLKKYREDQLAKVGMSGVFPLWKIPTPQLAREFIQLGFKAVIVCVNEKNLDSSFVGRTIDQNFLNDLPANVDSCGENGEFHSFVYDGPIFCKPIRFQIGEIIYRRYQPTNKDGDDTDESSTPKFSVVTDTGFWYCDLLPVVEYETV